MNFLQRRQSIKHRHLDVHKNHVRAHFSSLFHRILSVDRLQYDHSIPPADPQDLSNRLTLHLLVIRNQYLESVTHVFFPPHSSVEYGL